MTFQEALLQNNESWNLILHYNHEVTFFYIVVYFLYTMESKVINWLVTVKWNKHVFLGDKP
jgi:hypothetical protein